MTAKQFLNERGNPQTNEQLEHLMDAYHALKSLPMQEALEGMFMSSAAARGTMSGMIDTLEEHTEDVKTIIAAAKISAKGLETATRKVLMQMTKDNILFDQKRLDVVREKFKADF